MILKIRRNYGDYWNEVPEQVVECDEYEKRAYHEADLDVDNAVSIYCDEAGKVKPTITLTMYRNRKFANMFLLGNATVFVMNNEGKTIDTIYT
jgi:hypothetical protein